MSDERKRYLRKVKMQKVIILGSQILLLIVFLLKT